MKIVKLYTAVLFPLMTISFSFTARRAQVCELGAPLTRNFRRGKNPRDPVLPVKIEDP